MSKHQKARDNNYTIKIPANASKEEIQKFMKEFLKHWGKDKESTEPSSKQDKV